MRNFYCSLALIAASTLWAGQARADIVQNYTMDFNKSISTTAHDFKVGSGWGHIVGKYTTEGWSSEDYYVSYTYSSTDGRNGSGAIKVGSQTIDDDYNYDVGPVNDLLVTPAITGKASIWVKKTSSWSSSTIKFYAVTLENGKYKMGDQIEVEIPKLSTDWVQVNLPEQNNQYIGIRAENLYIDDFAADNADIELQKSLLVSKVSYKGKDKVDCDANGKFPVEYEVTITNNGDLDLTEGTEGYSLSVRNYSKNKAVVFTQPLKGNLAVGASTTVTVSGTANCNTYPDRNRYDVYEDLTNTSKAGAWIEPVPYKPVLTMRNDDGKIDNGNETFAWGMVNASTDKTFKISNDGAAPLNITKVVVPDGFTTSLAAPLTIAAHETKDFTVTMTAEKPGIYSGEFKVSGEGVDDFSFNVSGTVLDPAKYYANFNDNQIPAGAYAEDGWSVAQRDVASSDNPYLLSNGSQDKDNKFVTPLLKVAEGEKMSVDVARTNYYTGGEGVYLNVYYSADRTNWTLARKITANELSEDRAVNYTYYYSKLKTFVIDNIPAGNYYIGFGAGYTSIDNIYGFEKVDVAHDLMLTASKLPATAVVNNAYTATATLLNVNAKDEAADSYTASLYVDGEVVATAPAKAIASGEKAEFSFSYTPHKAGAAEAYIEFKNAADNYTVASEKVSVDVKEEQATGTVTVGNGNTTSNKTAIDWYDANGSGAHMDNLYKPEMLEKYGLKKGAKITSVSYTGTSFNDKTVSDILLTAYVGAVDAAKFEAGKNYESLQKVDVYTGKSTIDFVDGKTYTTTITLPEPVIWDGTSAIRVLTYVKADKYVNVKFNADDSDNNSYYGSGAPGEASSLSAKPTAVAEFGIQTEPSVIAGNITWKNKAVAGATVTLTSGDVIYTGASDDKGAYSIDVIQNDKKYNLTVSAPGYIDYTENDVDLSKSLNKNIMLEKVGPVAFDESKDNTIEEKTGVDVTLKRTMKVDKWNTFCVPFSIDATQIADQFGEGTQVAEYESSDNSRINFATTDTGIKAGKAYIVKPTKAAAAEGYTFNNVDITAVEPATETVATDIAFRGIYNPTDITVGLPANTFAAGIVDNVVMKAAEGSNMNGFRAFFIIPAGNGSQSSYMLSIDGTATSINAINGAEAVVDAPVYNIQGQRVDGNNLTPGIYVKAGKKFVVK
ncbi:carboxypeptidase regulatory-like domain-containing protein [Prevotella sp.]|uniref:carboxypeptidase regulatory-like domain-containing protein n=1 Tax=Prevotella sp. TaxID=59823 RepID=UPI0027E2B2B1|nr:carboxypeptidase regulatory-like domain-containing protein [Prevotella sp.]